MSTSKPRIRSHWGWGWADKFPTQAARQGMGKQLHALLGISDLNASDPVPLDQATIAPSRVAAPDSLSNIMTSVADVRAGYALGSSYCDVIRGFSGDFSTAPDLVAKPTTEAHITDLLDWAASADVKVVPYGGGTSVVGGIEPPRARGPIVSMDLRGLNKVLEVDRQSQLARIQAGALGPGIEAQLAEAGLTLRHFPQSFEHSTLGGWIATRAGGHFATVYTHIDDLVASTRMITPRGVMESRRLPGSGAGPSPDRMVIGSEGILGVITEAWMRVRPRLIYRASASVFFTDYAQATAATRALAQSGLFPSNCRLLDKREAMLNMLPTKGRHVLIIGFESADHAQNHKMERALELAADHGGVCDKGPKYREGGAKRADGADSSWRSQFIEGPYLQNILVSLGVLVDTFETACTWDRFDSLHSAIVKNVLQAMKDVAGGGHISCRFTHVYPDGPAPYYTFICKGRPGAELEQWATIKAAASEALMANQATITHHHAVGRVHRPWYDRQRPDLFADALRAAKTALDPTGILNPGVLID